jgi:cytochrome c-type biogenesis protein CcmH/NrfG
MTVKNFFKKRGGGIPAIVLVAGVALLYWVYPPIQKGKAEDLTSSEPVLTSMAFKESHASPTKLDSVDRMLDGLRSRLEKTPEDMDGWVLLAKSYHHLQRWSDATAALEKAKSLGYSGQVPELTTPKPQSFKAGEHPPLRNQIDNPDVLMPYIEQAINR